MAHTIATLAREGGVGVETVRYYQRRGLLRTPEKSGGSALSGGVRRYDAEDVRRLRFIRSAQAAGFTLEQIGELLELDAGHDRARARALAGQRIAALDDKIAELQAARASLARLAHACAASEAGPCPIIEAFESGSARPPASLARALPTDRPQRLDISPASPAPGPGSRPGR